jgi:putative transposase
MNISTSDYKRKSHMFLGQIYFWTATINQWQYLLQKDQYKQVIIDSLAYLSKKNKIDVFAFIIMPNHIHLIWRIKMMNGKEKPSASLLKYTAHEFRKMLLKERKGRLSRYACRLSIKTMNSGKEIHWPFIYIQML